MKRAFLLSILFVTTLVSCTHKPVYQQFYTFDDGVWNRFKKLDFNIPVEKVGVEYDIVLILEYDVNFPEDKLPFHVIMDTPAGEERIKEYNVRLRGYNGTIYGKVTDNKAIQEITLRKGYAFSKKGIVNLNLECFYPKYDIQGIYKVGIELRKTDNDD